MKDGARDLGKGLNQEKIASDHWRIEGYDVYVWACWEGTHTSRGANIYKDGELVERVRLLSAARAWIRGQVGK
jgi:hypothetical protein